MPIPQLSQKIHSPQNWKKKSIKKYKPEHSRILLGKKPYHQTKGSKKMISLLLIVLFFVFFFAGTGSFAFIAWFSRELPNPNKIIDRQIAQSTKIYDRTGEVLFYDIYGKERRTVLELDDVPKHVIWATLAAEDKNFYKHSGFSLRSILRATLVNLMGRGKIQGGSTISQQLVKNSILNPEKTYTRKIKELVLAYQIEKKFTKDQILKMYLNEIPYGGATYGIESASQTFFGKSARDLNLAESALLSALPKAPTYYSPYGNHINELIGRWQYILDVMAEEGYINQKEAEAAKKTDILAEVQTRRDNILAPHFVMYIKEMLVEKYGERMVESGGLKVYTSLDFELQKIAEKLLEDSEDFLNGYGATNAALAALDPRTGQILAMVGSINYFNKDIDGNVNVALRPRQPGSSFKPVVYAAAFAKGYTPNTVLYDVPTVFKTEINKDYEPKNYGLKTYGPVTMRQALAGSLNIPAVKTIYLTGINNVLSLAEGMGYTTFGDRSRFGLSLVLGGGEVKLLEHVAAFGIFAAEGVRQPLTPILKIEDSQGRILEEWRKIPGERVIEENIARQITNILSDNQARVFVFGAQNYLNLGERPAAVKTGTTNDYRDAWTIGATPSLAVGVWVGKNDNTEMGNKAAGGNVAAPLWNTFMKRALAGAPIENFNEPEIPEIGKPILDGDTSAGVKIKIDRVTGKLATEYTPKSQVIEQIYKQAHSILHYINKDDPQGKTPEDPAEDPQYDNWEQAVQKWAKEQGFVQENPPAEYDDLHLPENKPEIQIIFPAKEENINTREMTVRVQASAPRGVQRVEYYVDGKFLAVSYKTPLESILKIPGNLPKGFHTLTARAYDDIDNNQYDEIIFNLTAEQEPLPITWISPRNKSLIPSFPVELSIYLPELDIQNINFYYSREEEDNYQLIKSLPEPKNHNIAFSWDKAPASGRYKIKAEIFYLLGRKQENEINVEIR